MSSHPDKRVLRRKYDAAAPTYSNRYADASAVARRQVALVEGWGSKLAPGDTVLELGCADGLVTEALATAGFVVTAVDLSPVMVETARQRIHHAGLHAAFAVGDVESIDFGRRFDAVLALMCSFFAYAADPHSTLIRLGEHARAKLLVDANPRVVSPRMAVAAVAGAGFDRVAWRPFLVPQRRRLPVSALYTLAGAERIPGVRSLPLRWRGNVVIKGEGLRWE